MRVLRKLSEILISAIPTSEIQNFRILVVVAARRWQRTRVLHQLGQLVGCRRGPLSTSSSLSGSPFNASVPNDMSS